MSGRVAAIVLAGGRSSRFGRDKLVERSGDRTLLEHAIAGVASVADEVIVVGPVDHLRVVPAGVRALSDERPFEGPLAGLVTGLRALDPGIERVVVVGGDMPTLVPAVLGRLVAALDRHEAAVLLDDEGPRPLPLALQPAAATPVAVALIASGERRLRALLERLEVETVPAALWRLDDPSGETLRDVDEPGDLVEPG
jgi:molybdopterin-guanine dinucleotide biosynthesis protein A